jgi:hypothetical protein
MKQPKKVEVGPTEIPTPFVGIVLEGQSWAGLIEHPSGVVSRFGSYNNPVAAAVAHDMEALRLYGDRVPASSLNFQYTLRSMSKNVNMNQNEHGDADSEKEENEERQRSLGDKDRAELPSKSKQSSIEMVDYRVEDHSGLEFELISFKDPSEYFPCDLVRQSPQPVHLTTLLTGDGMPPPSDNGRDWLERISSAHTPSTAFSYEIKFFHQKSLGLNLRPMVILYGSGSGSRTMSVLAVMESSSALKDIVQSGDLILKVNDSVLFQDTADFDFEKVTRSITSAAAPRLIRFLRTSGNSNTMSPSQIELMTHDPPIGSFSVTAEGVLQNIVTDSIAPMVIKKLVQGSKVQWEHCGHINSSPFSNFSRMKGDHISVQTRGVLSTRDVAEIARIYSTSAVRRGASLHPGLYREKGKYAVSLKTTPGRSAYLGRYETEEEATLVCKRARHELELSGGFVARTVMEANTWNLLTPSVGQIYHQIFVNPGELNGTGVPSHHNVYGAQTTTAAAAAATTAYIGQGSVSSAAPNSAPQPNTAPTTASQPPT